MNFFFFNSKILKSTNKIILKMCVLFVAFVLMFWHATSCRKRVQRSGQTNRSLLRWYQNWITVSWRCYYFEYPILGCRRQCLEHKYRRFTFRFILFLKLISSFSDLINFLEDEEVPEQSINDGKLEVVGIHSSFHIAQLSIGLSKPHRLGQAHKIKV